MDPNSNVIKHIDQTIKKGDAREARRLVYRLLKVEGDSPELRFYAADFLRRISKYDEALRVLKTEIEVDRYREGPELDLKIQILTLRLLNLVGASDFALKAAGRYPQSIQQLFAATFSEIYLSNYQFDQARKLMKNLETQPIDKMEYRDRLGLVSVCDCLNGTEKYQEAAKLLRELIAKSSEPVLLGISHQVLATSLVSQGLANEALENLKKAEAYFGDTPSTFDAAFVSKWYGVSYIELGDYDLALSHLENAWSILYRPGYKPEGWLEILYFMGLARFRKTAKFPHEWQRFLAYPSTHKRYTDRVLKEAPLPIDIYLSHLKVLKTRTVPHIDLGCDIQVDGLKREKTALSLNATDQMHYWLLTAGEYGIPVFRFLDILWNGDSFSLVHFQKRFEQVLIRLRAEKVKVKLDEHHLLLESSASFARWTSRPMVKGQPFLEKNKMFKLSDVETYFDISQRSAFTLCKEWRDSKKVEKVKGAYQSIV